VRLEFYGYPADYLETYKAGLEKVTLADLTAAAKKYIHPEKLAILVVAMDPRSARTGCAGAGSGADNRHYHTDAGQAGSAPGHAEKKP